MRATRKAYSATPMKFMILIGALAIFIINSGVAATNMQNQHPMWDKVSFLRQRILSTVVSETIPCLTITDNSCKCPGACMMPQNTSTPVCKLNKCYGWNKNLNKCVESGPAFTPALVLQAIPFTGIFGSGFGNMARWDIFGIYMTVVFGPIALLIIGCCCVMFGCCHQDEACADCGKCLLSCLGCLWGIAIVAMWIWGIVTIANKTTLGPNGCPLV